MTKPAASGWSAEVAFLRRTLIAAAVVILLLFAWWVRGALLLGFAAVLIAVLIRGVADALARRLGFPARWSVLAACVAIFLPLGLALLLVGGEIRAQAALLLTRIPEAADTLERLTGWEIAGRAGAALEAADASTVGAVAWQAASYALVALDAVAALVLAVVGGIYLAADPATYRRGLARLLPHGQQERVGDAMVAAGRALRLWLKARLMAMAAVGLLTGLGAWAIGLPAPLALGLFAGLADIVPLVGPFIGALPGVLLALDEGWETIAWTVALYVAVQQLEGYVLTPLLEQRMVSIPPALLLFSVVAAGTVFGPVGVVLAGPLTVVLVVLVGKLYVRGTLGRPVEVPGEKAREESREDPGAEPR
jgi:predicted PurR-regulated permease PerM